jgi:hypothetical protein
MKMDKQTQMYVGLGVVAVAGYLLYANWKKKQEVQVLAGSDVTVPPAAKSFASLDATIAGNRKGMVGMDATQKQNAVIKDSDFAWGKKSFSAQNEVIKDGSWSNAVGDNIAPNFFQVHDSKNSYRNR